MKKTNQTKKTKDLESMPNFSLGLTPSEEEGEMKDKKVKNQRTRVDFTPEDASPAAATIEDLDDVTEAGHFAMNTFPRDIFDMGEKSDLMVQEAYQSDPFDGELNWIREDIPTAIIEKSSVVMEETRNEDSDFD
ncbi:hypothetical protein P8452_49342 [Trifolium repens]|nr:hypothetical protein P8452_49342 [Trifolium repens]